MPKLKREIFLRHVRMTHRFGEKDDPLMPPAQQIFEMPYPNLSKLSKNSKGVNIKENGLYQRIEPYSPVMKAKGGHASLSGPNLDVPDAQGANAPWSTVGRRTQGPYIRSEAEAIKRGGKK